MAKIDIIYKQLAEGIINTGHIYEDESRGINCKQLSSVYMPISLNEFPLLTTKKMHTKSIVGELIWFLRGDNNIKYLVDNGINIWNKDAYNWYKKHFQDSDTSLEEFSNMAGKSTSSPLVGDVGRNYGKQWRDWTIAPENEFPRVGFDQMTNLFKQLKDKPMNRRNIVTAWNPAELNLTALPPCHRSFEIIPRPLREFEKIDMLIKHGEDKVYLSALWEAKHKGDKEAEKLLDNKLNQIEAQYALTLKWDQRSVDTFLGLPFNIASYGILAKMIGGLSGMVATDIIGNLSNVHFYEPHIKTVQEQLRRDVNAYSGCQIEFSKKVEDNFLRFRREEISFDDFIQDFEIEDVTFTNYNSFPALKAEMFAPKK